MNKGWQSIETAPRDDVLLLWARLKNPGENVSLESNTFRRYVGFWDQIDGAWADGGPTADRFLEPTLWHVLPDLPCPPPYAESHKLGR
jgi:hypothetical protein